MSEPRRFIAVIQDPRGYPASNAPLEPAPPEGPAQPMLWSVVKADDFEAVTAERDALAARVEELGARIARAVYALSDFALTDKQAVERALPILRGEDER